jgi:MFS family permease
LVVGVFYVFWFFGAAYISKVSDYIGRKKGMVICLIGALAGYVLTVLAIEVSNYYLLLLSRAISGFTAGNQPIAQAALVDISRTDEERTRNMGKVVAAFAVAFPTMLALFSISADQDEQGWVMGITIALFTLGCGIISLAGGALMDIDAHLPFITGIASSLVALIFINKLWRQSDVKALDTVEQ